MSLCKNAIAVSLSTSQVGYAPCFIMYDRAKSESGTKIFPLTCPMATPDLIGLKSSNTRHSSEMTLGIAIILSDLSVNSASILIREWKS